MTQTQTNVETIATQLIGHFEQVGLKLATLAEAIPEKHYETKVTESVHTIGDVLRHVAFWNQYVADSTRGKKADETPNELRKAKYATKERILGALKKSIAESASALMEHVSSLSPETSETILSFIEHTSEHYGQLVVYARLHSVTPPTSVSK